MKNKLLTPIKAVDTFVKCKKEGAPVPVAVWDTLRTYSKWNQVELTGLLNASAYYPEILFESGMEKNIAGLLSSFQDRIVEIPIK
ncbi:hypothetical protein ACE5IS_06015 [Leptospira wolffii]|uniref:Uncharacterized protein n=1 Tax=Leptospira wolffii TaxID=409998 RepID=A0A2M9ZF91_9LEPT|nr:hypothetical protein [Leptospira wolffii]EPG65210.1 hypothetical protein LEP1GSC061_3047 [Leptospira wolffii serovar Khorat str. Khorat-H2]PJZ67073.1 hypothetical protein CH371_03075 [Leptospira wolffii]TGK62050.1 hypothetical protein EHQ32_04215 [Leptospira wolffii]TGK68651.1 hypothetical protein EHQ27_13655 [Leptospira wolffii]TGK74565.1 hypothetical protein EHQ35_09565 [Leptospira wolffii]